MMMDIAASPYGPWVPDSVPDWRPFVPPCRPDGYDPYAPPAVPAAPTA